MDIQSQPSQPSKPVICNYCQSDHVIKYGKYKETQYYLAEVREKLAYVLCRSTPLAKSALRQVDEQLSTPVSRGGGVCKECKGVKKIQYGKKGVNPIYFVTCPTCNGTGQKPVVTKTLGQLVKEFEDDSRS